MRTMLFRIALLLTLALPLLSLTGCGGTSGPVTPVESEVTPSGPEPEPGAEPTLPEEGP
jgi:hypothetical protein